MVWKCRLPATHGVRVAEFETWMYQRIVDDAPEAIVVADRNGAILFWNAGAEALFGYSASEATGQTLDLIVPPKQRERHWTGYQQTMLTGTTRYGHDMLAVPAVRKDGTRISLEFHVVLLRDANDEVVGIAAIMRDVTSRWERERSLQQRLRALESELGSTT